MNIFITGNGFDLNHNFPTSYNNFMNTVSFLTTHYEESMDTVGKVLGHEHLLKADRRIKECYEFHSWIYNETELKKESAEKLIAKANWNIWFSYFCKSFKRNCTWIDFEKEISLVIHAFEMFFDSLGAVAKTDEQFRNLYILNEFAFFYNGEPEDYINGFFDVEDIKTEYLIEYPLGSGMQMINKEKIINDLYSALCELKDMLCTYLACFVNKPLELMLKLGHSASNKLYPDKIDYIFTYNYTYTFELLDKDSIIVPVHGNIKYKKEDDHIVLGVNPDGNDVIDPIDTSFVVFKKYFQRIVYDFLPWYRNELDAIIESKGKGEKIFLYVVGHSLDVTDEDTIKELFSLADYITIFYYDDDAKASCIKNLIKMYKHKDIYMEMSRNKNLEYKKHASADWDRVYK